jgi:hypothetical protein
MEYSDQEELNRRKAFICMGIGMVALVINFYEHIWGAVRDTYSHYQARVACWTIDSHRARYARMNATRSGMRLPTPDAETVIDRNDLILALEAARVTIARGSLPTPAQLKVLSRKPINMESTKHELMARYEDEIKAMCVIAERRMQTRQRIQNPKQISN